MLRYLFLAFVFSSVLVASIVSGLAYDRATNRAWRLTPGALLLSAADGSYTSTTLTAESIRAAAPARTVSSATFSGAMNGDKEFTVVVTRAGRSRMLEVLADWDDARVFNTSLGTTIDADLVDAGVLTAADLPSGGPRHFMSFMLVRGGNFRYGSATVSSAGVLSLMHQGRTVASRHVGSWPFYSGYHHGTTFRLATLVWEWQAPS